MTFEEALPLVRKVCWRYARKHYQLVDCDDLVNEIFLRCDFSKFDSMKGQGMGMYIQYRIIDHLREIFGRPGFLKSARKRGTVSLDCFENISSGSESNEVDDADAFDYLIAHLKTRDRFIVDQYYRHGLLQRQIAKQLGMTAGGVAYRLYMARESIRRKVG